MLRNNPEKDLGLGTCVGTIAGSPKDLHPNLGPTTSIEYKTHGSVGITCLFGGLDVVPLHRFGTHFNTSQEAQGSGSH
jgi:hypothetical protein